MKEGKFIGSGSEKNVFEHPRDPAKIIKTYKTEEIELDEKSPNHIRARYYLGKLLHILYPKNFPDMHLSSSEPNQVLMERKELDPEHKEIYEIERRASAEGGILSGKQINRIDSIIDARDKDPAVEQLRNDFLESDILLDGGGINYAYDEDGNVVFVDNVHPWAYTYSDSHPIVPNFNVKKLEAAIEKLENDQDKKLATVCLKRLQELYANEKKKVEERREEQVEE